MKIESLGQIKEIEQIQIPGILAPKFSEGEILIARVMQIEGGKVFLNNKNGAAFMALMQSDLGLAEGDMVEVIANGNGKGYTLNLLDVEYGQNASADRALPPGRGTVSGTLAMIKANPGLNPKAASFLVENNIPSSPDNISALNRIVHGQGLASLLTDVLSGIMDNAQYGDSTPITQGIKEEIAPEAANGLKTGRIDNKAPEDAGKGTSIPGTDNTSVPVKNTVADNSMQATDNNGDMTQNSAAAQVTKGETAESVKQQSPLSQQTAASQKDAAVPAPTATPEELAQPVVGVNSEREYTPVQTGVRAEPIQEQPGSKAEGAIPQNEPQAADDKALYDSGQQKTYIKEEIKLAIRDVFCRPEEQSGPEFKKAIADMPEKLDRLKLLLQNSDNKNEEVFTQKTQEAQKLLEVMSGIKKFDYVQIPFLLKDGQVRTAEMYVYRRNKNSVETGESGITILIALDTETIGRVETLIKAAGSKISLEFRLEHRELQQEIKKKAKILAQKMEDAGYRLKEIRLTGLETKTTVLNAGGLLQDAGAKQETIDVQI